MKLTWRTATFGPYTLDLRSGELRKFGTRINTGEQALQILLMLLESPGEMVTREQLRSRLWPQNTYVDFDHGLNSAVQRLRDCLSDSAAKPRWVETLPRRGYRFIGQVEWFEEANCKGVVPELPSPPVPSEVKVPVVEGTSSGVRSRRTMIWLAAVLIPLLLVVLLIGTNEGGWRDRLLPQGPKPKIRALAVLPLANLSADPNQEYFADGMTEELITELSRIGSLKVISRTSMMQYKGEKKKPLSQIGRELNVDAVMEGSVLLSGNRVRIAADLIYAPTDQHLMAETYERDLGDVLELQREVAESITKQVRLKLTPEQEARLHEVRGVNPEAYQAYLTANSLDFDRYEEIKRAQSYLEKAIQKDPGFAEAYVSLAGSYINLGQFRWLSPRDAYPPAKEVLSKALALDEKNCGALVCMFTRSLRGGLQESYSHFLFHFPVSH